MPLSQVRTIPCLALLDLRLLEVKFILYDCVISGCFLSSTLFVVTKLSSFNSNIHCVIGTSYWSVQIPQWRKLNAYDNDTIL